MRVSGLVLPCLWLWVSVSLPAALGSSPRQNFVNTAIARTIELGGATTQITTQYNVKASADAAEYWLPLGGVNDDEPAWWEVQVGGKVVDGIDIRSLAETDGVPTVVVPVGSVKKGSTFTLSLTTLLAHQSRPKPAAIEQTDPQYLLWETNSTYVDSWYPTDVERIKIRAPSPQIVGYGSVPKKYTRDSEVTKASSTLTLGPFHSLPPTLGPGAAQQAPFWVHYETKDPVVGLRTLKRSAEVSHWGANLNIQDEMALVNTGPKLKGHFSRLAHQQSKFHAGSPAQILKDMTIRVPPTARSAYYYDTIGNVSTSHFRPGSQPAIKTKASRAAARTVDGVLELRPRYPLLGGWNYTFVIGYDMPLGDVLKVENGTSGRKILGVPFLTAWKDLLVDQVETTIVLPEGATDVEVHTPFPVDSITHAVHKTYLDSTGRHAITLTKAWCTEHHAQNVYVTYSYPTAATLQKPLTVSAVVGGLFILAMGLRRIDYTIEKRKA